MHTIEHRHFERNRVIQRDKEGKMKALILGISMFTTGALGYALLCAAAVTSNFSVNNSRHYKDLWALSGVTPVATVFLIVAIAGAIIAILSTLLSLFWEKE